MQKFNDFGLNRELLKALEEIGYNQPTPIQQKTIKPILEGRDLIACAQTGTGKTAAFSLPMLNDMKRNGTIQALILTPTRELAIQINENIREYKKHLHLKSVVIYGGIKQGSQVRALEQGADILIATPGRLLDLISQGYIDLKNLNYFVLDEADNMLDMGFVHDIRKLIKLIPKQRQTLMFSATMPTEIKKLAQKILHNPLEIKVAPVSSAVDTVKQTLYYVDKTHKADLLLEIMDDKRFHSTLIFTRTKHGADKLVKILHKHKYKVAAIHGNKSQNKRAQTLADFKAGKINTLIATDIAARGLDIDDLSYVINYEIPNVPETYIHRIGRTGRAGREGEALSLCDSNEKSFIRDIQKLMKKEIEIKTNLSYPMSSKQAVKKDDNKDISKQRKTNKKKSNQTKTGKSKKETNNRKNNSKTKKDKGYQGKQNGNENLKRNTSKKRNDQGVKSRFNRQK